MTDCTHPHSAVATVDELLFNSGELTYMAGTCHCGADVLLTVDITAVEQDGHSTTLPARTKD